MIDKFNQQTEAGKSPGRLHRVSAPPRQIRTDSSGDADVIQPRL